MKTIDGLYIMWRFSGEAGSSFEEVFGLIFYGYWVEDFDVSIVDEIWTFREIWSDGLVEILPRNWEGANNANLAIEVRFERVDSTRWLKSVEHSLRWFTARGAEIAWCGGEDCTQSIDVIVSDTSPGDVYAAYSDHAGFHCLADLHAELIGLSSREIDILRDKLRLRAR